MQKISSRLRLLWAISFVLLLISGAYIASFDGRHMHHDERWTYDDMVASPIGVIEVQSQNVHPPGWFLSFWFWQASAGRSEFAGRYHVMLLTLVTLSVAYRFASDAFGHWRYGLYAMLCLSVHAVFYRFTLDIRPYSAVFLIATLSTWLVWRWSQRSTWRNALLYGLSACALMYVHYYLAFLVIAHALFVLSLRPTLSQIKQYIIAGGLALALWLLWLPVLITQIEFLQGIAVDYGGTGRALSPSPTLPTNLTTLETILSATGNGYLLLLPIVIIVGIGYFWQKRAFWLLLAWALVPQLLVLFANQYADLYTIRYVGYTHIATAILLGIVLARLPKFINNVAILGTILILGIAIPNQLPDQIPYRHLIAELEAIETSETAIFYFDQANSEIPSDQFERYFPEEWYEQAIFDDYDEVLARLPTADVIWHITHDWYTDDVRDRFRYLSNEGTLVTIIGDCSPDWCMLFQRIDLPVLQSALEYDIGLSFYGAEWDTSTSVNSELPVTLWWSASTVPQEPLSIGVYLLDEWGQLVAQTDGAIQDYYAGEVQLSQLDIERNFYRDTRYLTLTGLPSGDYQLVLAIYNWQTGERIPNQEGDTLIELGIVRLP